MNIRCIFYLALISTTFLKIVAEDPLTPEQARKLNPETGIYQIYFNEITEGKFNIRLHGENRIEIGCVGYLSHGKWFVQNYLTDVQGYHPIHNLNIPFTVVPESGQSFSIVFIEILPTCGSYYELFLASKDSDNKPDSTNEVIQTARPPQTTYTNTKPAIKSTPYPYTSIDSWNNTTDDSYTNTVPEPTVRHRAPYEREHQKTPYTSKEPTLNTGSSTITPITDYFGTPKTSTAWPPTSVPTIRYSETSNNYTVRPGQITNTVRTPTGYPRTHQPTGTPFSEESTKITQNVTEPQTTTPFTWAVTPTASTTRPTPIITTQKYVTPNENSQPPPPFLITTRYPKPITPTYLEPNPSETSHRQIIESTTTPRSKIPICIPDVPKSIEFTSHFSNHADEPEEEGPDTPFRISLENCKCTCPNAKKIPRHILKGKTFDLV